MMLTLKTMAQLTGISAVGALLLIGVAGPCVTVVYGAHTFFSLLTAIMA